MAYDKDRGDMDNRDSVIAKLDREFREFAYAPGMGQYTTNKGKEWLLSFLRENLPVAPRRKVVWPEKKEEAETCSKCGGCGRFPSHPHIESKRCEKCGGIGKVPRNDYKQFNEGIAACIKAFEESQPLTVDRRRGIMRKLIAVKDFPNARKGDLIPIDDSGFAVDHGGWAVEFLLREGFVKEVEEEKSLEEKIGMHEYPKEKEFWELRAKIATDHFRKKFDEAYEKRLMAYSGSTIMYKPDIKHIRETLFGDEK